MDHGNNGPAARPRRNNAAYRRAPANPGFPAGDNRNVAFAQDENVPLAPEENDDNNNGNNDNNDNEGENGVIDSGVVVVNGHSDAPSGDGNFKLPPDPDLILLLQCHEDLLGFKRGTTVSVGLFKTTKLHSVFSHFVRFCTASSRNKEPLSQTDLEFVHDQILSGNETAEGSALMKNDVIKVRRKDAKQAELKVLKERMQRESDALYFDQMKKLIFEGNHDLVIECRGVLNDKSKLCRSHAVAPTLRAHSSIVSKRCPWLKERIRHSLETKKIYPVVRIPNESAAIPIETGTQAEKILDENDETETAMDCVCASENKTKVVVNDRSPADTNEKKLELDGRSEINVGDTDEEEEDDDAVQLLPLLRKKSRERSKNRPAAEVVVEEDDPPPVRRAMRVPRQSEPEIRLTSAKQDNEESNNDPSKQMVWVVLENHPPEAVRLLLEYCYTNRCVPLGRDAFNQASKGKVVPPIWDAKVRGSPTVSMSIALAGIKLAEEARLPRFSLMCEVAATHLVRKNNVTDALCTCTSSSRNGNGLPLLRKKAMSCMLEKSVLSNLTSSSDFQRILQEKSGLIVPSILTGLVDANSKKRKREVRNSFALRRYDEEDRIARERERRRNLKKRLQMRFKDTGHTDSFEEFGNYCVDF